MTTQHTQTNKSEKQHLKKVWYAGTDTLKIGYLVCYDRDYITGGAATVANLGRAWQVEKPAAANLKWFAGIVASLPSKTGEPGPIDIIESIGNPLANIFCDVTGVIEGTTRTLVTLVAGAYVGGKIGEGPVIAKCQQTVDRDTVNDLIMCEFMGLAREERIKTINAGGTGPSPLIWDQCPLAEIQADPSIGFMFWDDFMGQIDTTTGDGWIVTQTTSGAILGGVLDAGGTMFMDSQGNNAADDGIEAQLSNCMVKPAAGVKIFFETRLKINDTSADINQIYIGLCEILTDILDTGQIDDTKDKVGFFITEDQTGDALATITAKQAADDVTDNLITVADDTWINVGFVIDGVTSVKFYANGALVETGTTVASLPTAVMCLSYGCKTEGASKDAEMTIDWVRLAQVGGRST